MKNVSAAKISRAVEKLCVKMNYNLAPDVLESLESALTWEKNILAKKTLKQIIENAVFAKKNKIPLCQDTGAVEVFVEIGQELCIKGGLISDAINLGVRNAYTKNGFRMSIVSDPLERKNTLTNIPGTVYFTESKTDNLRIKIILKGAGSENSSAINFFPPSASWREIEEFILQLVCKKAAYSCPPVIISAALGGNFATAPAVSKKALFRKLSSANPNRFYAKMERQLLKKINSLGIGPMGTGGSTTALAVFLSGVPVHMASLPCAVTIQCHSLRRGEIIL